VDANGLSSDLGPARISGFCQKTRLSKKGYQNLSHTRWGVDDGSRPRGEYQLGRLLQTTKWQSVSLDRPSDVRRCSFERPFMADAVEKVAVWLFQFVCKKIDR